MNSVHHVTLSMGAECNNIAVDHFEAGNFAQALVLFRDAYHGFSRVGAIAQEDNFLPTTILGRVTDPQTPLRNASRRLVEKRKSNSSEDGFLYEYPFQVVATPKAYSSDPAVNQAILSAMVAWNMALVYHLNRKIGGNQVKNLRKAYAMYHHSWGLIQSHVLVEGRRRSGSPMADLFAQALMNNLADCAWQLQKYDDARSWTQRLVTYSRSIPILPYKNYDPNVTPTLRELTFQFCLNALMMLEAVPTYVAQCA
jgi:hypothetical protein